MISQIEIPSHYAINFPVPFIRNEQYSYEPVTIEDSIEQKIFEKIFPPFAMSQATFVDFFTQTVRKGCGCRNAWINAEMLLQRGYNLKSDDEIGIEALLGRDGFIGDAHHNGARNFSVTGQVVEKTKRVKRLLARKMDRQDKAWKNYGVTEFMDKAFESISGAFSDEGIEQIQIFKTLGGISFELHSLYRKIDDQNVLTVWVIPASVEVIYNASELGVEPQLSSELCRVAHFEVEESEVRMMLSLLDPFDSDFRI